MSLCFIMLCANAQRGIVHFEQIVDNTVELGSDIKTMVLMSRAANDIYQNYNSDSLTKVLVNNNLTIGSQLLADSSSIDTLLTSMASSLYNSGRYEVVIPTDINIHRVEDYDVVPAPLAWDEVSEYCELYNADALVVLERYFNSLDCFLRDDYYESGIYSFFEVVGFYAYVRVYDAKNKKIASKYACADTLAWEGIYSVSRGLLSDVPTIKEAVISTAFIAGEDCAKLISPVWKEQVRKFFYTSNSAQTKENELFMPENYSEGEAYWMNLLAGDASAKKKSRAAYNLAVLYEMNGHTKEAMIWAEKAIGLKYDILYERYIKVLKDRISLESRLGLLSSEHSD